MGRLNENFYTLAVIAGLSGCGGNFQENIENPAGIVNDAPEKQVEFHSETVEKQSEKKYHFKVQKQIKATPVKDQAGSGTCWSFSGISFLESELIRAGKGEYDLSEMFIVRNAYEEKAERYVRMHGHLNFGAGGLFHDVMNVVRENGLVPENIYTGMNIGEKEHLHSEMDNVLKAYVDAVTENKNKKLTPAWFNGFEGILDAYLGGIPKTFSYKGKRYTPKSFSEGLDLSIDNYVSISSFTHHPFYGKFVLEIPDNWASGEMYNLPLSDIASVMENAINNGYSFTWGGDISDIGFSSGEGIAIVPEKDWGEMSTEEVSNVFSEPVFQKEITPEMRQTAFDNYNTTDDHVMHIVGVAKDQNGTKYYLTKNSWGAEIGPYNGYLYISEAFLLYKATVISLNKEAVPKKIAEKLDL
ncbi:MAG: C1 family peptidase [Nanoarchaeota archaeon]